MPSSHLYVIWQVHNVEIWPCYKTLDLYYITMLDQELMFIGTI